MIYCELYNSGVKELEDAQIVEASLDARLLLEYVCGTDRNALLVHPDLSVDIENENKYRDLISKRAKHVPLQYLTGYQEFMGIEFEVNENVLIPRQDTEFVVEEVLKYAQDGMRVLDICTGSGCILLSIMHYKNNIEGVGLDLSENALEVARRNALTHDMESAVFAKSDVFEALKGGMPQKDSSGVLINDYSGKEVLIPGRYDIIVSNPPYIENKIIDTLMPEVRDYEPRMALDGGNDGLDFYKRISDEARKYLTNYGMIFFEIGYNQAEAVTKILDSLGYRDITSLNDYAGNPRVVHAKYICDL